MNFKKVSLSLLALLALAIAACGGGGAPATATSKVRVAVLPILDALPMYVAQEQGLFEKNGIQVELISAGSAPKRDEMINAEQADAMINEIVSTLFYNKNQTQVQIVRFARTAMPGSPMFRLLVSGKSGIADVSGLKGVEIGISQGTVIEYLTDRMLQSEGFTPDEIKNIAVPDIGQRMALLASGELKAATLPDPLAFLAMQQGAQVVLDDSKYPGFAHSTYAFRKKFIDQNPETVRKFLAAIEEAVALINQDPQKWSNLLVEQKAVPEALAGTFQIPTFVTASNPTEEQWNDVMSWAQDKGLISKDVSFADSVNSSFLPK